LLLLIGACGSDTATTTTTKAAAATTTTGAGGTTTTASKAASGQPLVIGLVSQELGQAALKDFAIGARAAKDYVNEQLNGIGGRPLQFLECLTDGSPEKSAACGNQFVEAKVALVFDTVDLGDPALHPILDTAGIPFVGEEPFTVEDSQSK